MDTAAKANNIAGKLRFIEKLLSGVVDYSTRKELMACSRAGREHIYRQRANPSTLYGVMTHRPSGQKPSQARILLPQTIFPILEVLMAENLNRSLSYRVHRSPRPASTPSRYA